MDYARKVWGTIIVVAGAALFAYGAYQSYDVYRDYRSATAAGRLMQGLFGMGRPNPAMEDFAAEFRRAALEQGMKQGFLALVGLGMCWGGTVLLGGLGFVQVRRVTSEAGCKTAEPPFREAPAAHARRAPPLREPRQQTAAEGPDPQGPAARPKEPPSPRIPTPREADPEDDYRYRGPTPD